jgi:hypothetical protein
MIEMIAVVVMLRSKENNSHAPYDNDIISYGEKRYHTHYHHRPMSCLYGLAKF